MSAALERFLRYVVRNTRSDSGSGRHPSTPEQLAFGGMLATELEHLGAEKITRFPEGCVFASFAASPGCETVPVLGLIAHMDTSEAASGSGVSPRIVTFDGAPLPLGDSGKVLDMQRFPALRDCIGKEIVVTDGTTLLGADDKAGIAEILTAVEEVLVQKIPHGKIAVGFTPDEEIGEGALFFDPGKFGADYAYTVDGGSVRKIEYQNFNAAEAQLEFHGVSVHPGYAKGTMVNALRLAMEFDAMLPEDEVPEKTSGTQGFFHLCSLSGDVNLAKSSYLLRDHDSASFARRHSQMEECAKLLEQRRGPNCVRLTIREQYRNMEEIIARYPFLVTLARAAVRSAGLEPQDEPIRGGTDGAMLSFRGLPCPNLGTGGYNAHGEYEYLSVQEMEDSVRILKYVISAFAGGAVPRKD